MLRRDFLKSSSLVFSGLLVISQIPQSFVCEDAHAAESSYTPVYRFNGHARSGCATPPELMPMLERGMVIIPR